MKESELSSQVGAHWAWKQSLVESICRYEEWLKKNQLLTEEANSRLQETIHTLGNEDTLIAFVGEFSRGKTELINALFFADYDQRILPSKAGRTTMCPTEIFYDRQDQRCYIKLLPIETRQADTSMKELNELGDWWHEVEIDPSKPETMAEALKQVSKVKSVPPKQAEELGFDPHHLEKCAEAPGLVIIPCWRHAIISIEHPLLQQGLRILDTPGLNALGSEPELTLNMLPKAQAVVFVLAADTGVTASDMEVWESHIGALPQSRYLVKYAVMNKIDSLWDDIDGPDVVTHSIEQVHRNTARILDLSPEDIMPLSAKKGLVAKVRKDSDLLKKSGLLSLENALAKRLLSTREHIIKNKLLKDITTMALASRATVSGRYQMLHDQLDILAKATDSAKEINRMNENLRHEYAIYQKKLLTIKSSKNLVKQQWKVLNDKTSAKQLNTAIFEAHHKLRSSWSTLGMGRAIERFFLHISNELHHFHKESELANKMLHGIYGRFEQSGDPIKSPEIDSERYIKRLDELHIQADKFRTQLKTILTEQNIVVKRFVGTLVNQVKDLHADLRNEVNHWPNEAIRPLIQNTFEHKRILEQQMMRLKELVQTGKTRQQQKVITEKMMAEFEENIRTIDEICRDMQLPSSSRNKVIDLEHAKQNRKKAV
ncbi:dynamin family protein [Litoribacillus peritrichatus]|uniref:Dynamin-like GTPase family protein n=1 Tax=Litoribacillus peritrichatus TaxID=718191 RepID=A0ABP7MNE1_9GAMM